MVTLDSLCVTRRSVVLSATFSMIRIHWTLWRAAHIPRPIDFLSHSRSVRWLHSAVVLGTLWLRNVVRAVAVSRWTTVLRLHVDISHAARFGVLRDHVVLGQLGVLGDDVPGVDESGEETETAEEDVDDGVGGAETALDPDCEELVEDSKEMRGTRRRWGVAYLGVVGRGWRGRRGICRTCT